MQFKKTTIVPQGRYEYGQYLASGNVSNKITSVVYGGNNTTTGTGGGGGNLGGNEGDVTDNNFNMYLSQTNGDFDGALVAVTPQTASTRVVGFKGQEQMETYIGVIDQHTTASEIGGEIIYNPPLPANYGITGVTQGMAVVVTDNATTGTTLIVSIDNTCTANTGTLLIPCNISMNAMQDLEDNILDWVKAHDEGKTMSVVLEYTWIISAQAQSSYRLDLSNDAGSINCDEDGNVLTGATRPSCQATLYLGNDPYTGTSYSLIYNNSQNVTGLGYHTSNGVCYIDYDSPTYFNFEGDHLDIGIQAGVGGQPMGTKVFTITKSLPSEGHPATSYWLTFSSSGFKYDPNANPPTMTPSSITANLMMQVGQNTPTAATGCSIWYGYDTESPATQYTTGITPTVSAKYVSVKAVKGNLVSGPIVDGVEFLPILSDGKNGSGGTSVYRIDLTNENASINCDSDGNILSGAVRPTCTAQLYYGSSACTGVTYSISTASCSYSGVTIINPSEGKITFNPGTASTPFWFDTNYTSIEFTISAQIGAVEYGPAIMTVSRNIAGADGTPARSYWLALSADAIKVDSGNTATPSSITATAYAQIGDGTPYIISNVIKWGYNGSTSNTYTSAITVDKTKDYMTFRLMLDNIQRDIETVPILKDGEPGTSTPGRRGPAIRGPIDWYDGKEQSGRRWCNGDGPEETDKDWIDIIIKDGTTYRCITSYNEEGRPWSAVSSNWTAATEYDFVATQLLLASAASINFLTNNVLYLKDSDGNITGGAAGGDGINFWAGDETPENAEFQVWADGTMRATAGVFSGYIQMKYNFVTDLPVDYQISGSSVTSRYLSETNFLGVKQQDPPASASTSGDCYFNTSLGSTSIFTTGGTDITGVYRVFRTSWVTANNCKSGGVEIERGYMADSRAYLIADAYTGNYGMGEGGTLILPTPNESLNGFVYDIMVEPNIATRAPGSEFTALYVAIANYGKTGAKGFYVYSLSSGYLGQANKLALYGGRTRFVCIPQRDGSTSTPYYIWAITDSTGGFEMYENSNYLAAFAPVHGYDTEMYDPIYRIHAYHTAPNNKKNDTLYVSRD